MDEPAEAPQRSSSPPCTSDTELIVFLSFINWSKRATEILRGKLTQKPQWLQVPTLKMVKRDLSPDFTSQDNVSIVTETLVLVEVNDIPVTRLMAAHCGY